MERMEYMKRSGKAFRRCGMIIGAVLLLVAGLLAAPVAAQLPDYGKLFGTTEQSPAAEPAASQPQQSLPAIGAGAGASPIPGTDLSAADYARVAEAAPEPMLGTAEKAIRLFRERLVGMLRRSPGAFEDIGTTLAAASPTGYSVYFLGVAVFAVLMLVVGKAVTEFYIQFLARPTFFRMRATGLHGYADKLPILTYRVLLTALGLGLTVLTAAAVGLFFYENHQATQLTVITVFVTFAAVVLVDTIWRMVLAPFLPGCRLPEISDDNARRLYRWLTISSSIGIIGSAFCYWVEGLGLPREVHVLVTVLVMLVTLVLFLMLIRANHTTVSRVILSGRPRADATWLSRTGAASWAPLASLYLIFTWGDLSFRLIMGIGGGPARLLVPFATLIASLVVYAATIYLIERVFGHQHRIRMINIEAEERRLAEQRLASNDAPPGIGGTIASGAIASQDAEPDDEGGIEEQMVLGDDDTPPTPRVGMRTMEDLARRVASLFALGAGVYALALFWVGTDFITGNAVLNTGLDVLQVSFVGYIVFHATRIWLDRKIEDEGGDIVLTPGDEGGAAGVSRLATLLPLVRNFILIIILTTITLIVAMQLGANVAPLFAGAGILGLAIGFGSQALVRDILSGAFFLLDDAFRKGEYIDVGNVKGTVEKISLRSFQLRHHLGMLHTIPFGEIQHLTNFSRDWVMMKLPLRLTYDTDIEQVRKLIKKLGIALLDDPEIGSKFMQPLKSQGVIQMDDSAMIARVKFMTRPGDQWVVRKRVFAEIRELFEREGIKFAHREVTVRIPGLPSDRGLDDEEQRAVGAAAQNALSVVEAEQLAKTGTGGSRDDR
jgi:small-conductance mechanosensitive channel